MNDKLSLKALKMLIASAETFDEARDYVDLLVSKEATKQEVKQETEQTTKHTHMQSNGVVLFDKQGKSLLLRNYKGDTSFKPVNAGIRHDGHVFVVSKHEQTCALTKECEQYGASTYKRDVDALFDWNAKRNTDNIVKLGTDIKLKEGEVIPSLPMVVLMQHYKDDLNKAMYIIGGDRLDGDYYWSSTEYSAASAWTVNVNNIYYGIGGKSDAFAVRACSAAAD